MLNHQTRQAVRAPHSRMMIQERVKAAKAEFLEHVPNYEKARDAAMARYFQETTKTKPIDRASPEFLRKHLLKWAGLDSFILDTKQTMEAYDQALSFLSEVHGETINLSQSEYQALQKEDEPLNRLTRSIAGLLEYAEGREPEHIHWRNRGEFLTGLSTRAQAL